jgi:vitamin B12 transporter
MFDWNYYPGIDFSYSLSDKLKLISSANWSGRLPSYTELYYSDPSNQGNKNLLAEKATNYEIGTKYIGSSLFMQTAVFYRFGTNIIDWVKTNPTDKWQSNNTTNINTYGLEFSLKWNHEPKSEGNFCIKSFGFNYNFISMDKSSGEYLSKYVLDYLKNSANFFITYQLFKKITANCQFTFQDRNGTYLPYNYNISAYDPAKAYTPVYLIDLKISYRTKISELFLQAKNILDEKNQDIENVQLPGRWISGGLIINLRFNKKKQENKID